MAIPIDQGKVKAYFEYLPESGELVWRYNPSRDLAWNSRNVGKVAGSVSNITGYRQAGVDKQKLLVHRIIWVYFNGSIPDGMVVDHINRDRSDNRIENLRLLRHDENLKNCDRWDQFLSTGTWRGFDVAKRWRTPLKNRIPQVFAEFEAAVASGEFEGEQRKEMALDQSPAVEVPEQIEPKRKTKKAAPQAAPKDKVRYVQRKGVYVPCVLVDGVWYTLREGQDPSEFKKAMLGAAASLRSATEPAEVEGEAA